MRDERSESTVPIKDKVKAQMLIFERVLGAFVEEARR